MNKKFLIILLIFSIFIFKPVLAKDYKSQEIKYKYNVMKNDLKYKRDNKIINISPSGYMTDKEYEILSEYKDKSEIDYDIPQIERPTDFKYIPQPLYKIVKYNDPPGSPELALGRRLFLKKQINTQGVVSPDYTKMVYSAVYYYQDTGSTASDLFVIPMNSDQPPLTKILKANVAQRNPIPIISTDKAIDNYAAFRTLTPIDFSADSTKLLAKEKIGSSEDGIWETKAYVYDFTTNTEYDLYVLNEAIKYFWEEYMGLYLEAKRWDIIPLGFDTNNQNRIVVQAYAYTGEKPVYLGAWSIDTKGEQSQLVSFDKNAILNISSNGYKIAKDGVKEYQTVKIEEKMKQKQDKVIEKQKKAENKKTIKQIKEDYKYELKDLKANYKDEYRDNRKLQSFKGSTELTELEEAYKKYQQDQLQKDIKKVNKKIKKEQKKIDKIDSKIQKKSDETQNLIDTLYNNQSTQNVDDGNSKEE